MSDHKFQVGQTVHYRTPFTGRAAPPSAFTVEQLLPAHFADNQYRVVCNADDHRRVVRESELLS
jgi:hypothetical protein